MLNLRKTIQEVLNEIAAVDWRSAIKSGMNLIVGSRSGIDIIVLHDFNNNRNVGIIYLKPQGDDYEVIGVIADDGYGLLMYMAAMAHIHPRYLMSDRMSVSDDSKKVWKKIYDDKSIQRMHLEGNLVEFFEEIYLNMKYRKMGSEIKKLELIGIGSKEEDRIIGLGMSRFEDWLISN